MKGFDTPFQRFGWAGTFLLCCVTATSSHAATWVLGSASGKPGALLEVPLYFSGDGATVGADIAVGFSNTRLIIEQPAGELPTAAAGLCGWNGADRIGAVIFNSSNAPLPVGKTLVCTLTFRILANAPVGTTILREHDSHCSDAQGQSEFCTLQGGAITVLGPAPPQPPAPLPASTALFIQLVPPDSGKLSIAAAQSSDLREWDLRAFREVPPRHVQWLRRDRAVGERALRHQTRPYTTDAMLERVIVAEFASVEDRDHAQKLLGEDPAVQGTSVGENSSFHTGQIGQAPPPPNKIIDGIEAQAHLGRLNLPAAWNLAKGWGLIGVADNGIEPEHPELRSFTGSGSIGGSFVAGGNYLPFLSANIGGHYQPIYNLRETQKQPLSPGNIDNDAICDGPD